jgi:hypothetical protein
MCLSNDHQAKGKIMDKQETANNEVQGTLTQHAMLVAWGLYAQHLGLVESIEQVEMKQKTRQHKPQSKVLEFFVAILAGLPHLQDISRSAHPLDQDQIVAEAWGQVGWADYSGVSRTLQQVSHQEVEAIVAELNAISQPFIAGEMALALQKQGRLVYDGDLTGRPVSNSSLTYPDAAFGHMGDEVSLGYQAAVVSLESPTYGRLWLSTQLYPGDTVSVTQAQALVKAAEARTGVRPRRRTELVAMRLGAAEKIATCADERYAASAEQLKMAQQQQRESNLRLREWRQAQQTLEASYAQRGQPATAHDQLAQARRKVTTYEQRLPRQAEAVAVAERRLKRHALDCDQAFAEVERLRIQFAQLAQDNARNPQPIKAIFRLDSGFASRENLAWLIEMGYEIYSKARSTHVQQALAAQLTPARVWVPVGANATLTAWAATTVNEAFIYPLDVALARYQTGETVRHAVFLHYGEDPVTRDLDGWFHRYNARQTIEAGIKEGKNIFQMHHLKVRSTEALLLQEHLAAFAANFVRFALPWLAH